MAGEEYYNNMLNLLNDPAHLLLPLCRQSTAGERAQAVLVPKKNLISAAGIGVHMKIFLKCDLYPCCPPTPNARL